MGAASLGIASLGGPAAASAATGGIPQFKGTLYAAPGFSSQRNSMEKSPMSSASISDFENMRRLFLALAVAGISVAALTGCNTVEGAGEDIESAGDAIQDSADD
ncbi:MAG TPA: entericidin A/B family lipoprotein [Kiloniellaceae bacterium]